MNGFISKRNAANVLGVLAITVAVAGCDSDAASASIRQQNSSTPGSEPRAESAESIPADWPTGERPMLRYRVDAARGRLWALTLDGVDLYEFRTREKLAHIPLPDWAWVGEPYGCPPDLALGPKGEAVISSNVVPTLWRVDPLTFAASKHELVLDQDTDKDVGFSALTYSAEQGAFFAASGVHGSLWRIDPLFRRGQHVGLSAAIRNACALTVGFRASSQRASRSVGLCARSDRNEWTINLAPDQRSGHVGPGQCSDAFVASK